MDSIERYKGCKNFKIWHPEANDTKQVYLKLHQHDEHRIILQAVDHNGELIRGGHLLALDSEMNCIVTISGTNPSFPFMSDPSGSLLVYPEYQIRLMEQQSRNEIKINITDVISKNIKEALFSKIKEREGFSEDEYNEDKNIH